MRWFVLFAVLSTGCTTLRGTCEVSRQTDEFAGFSFTSYSGAPVEVDVTGRELNLVLMEEASGSWAIVADGASQDEVDIDRLVVVADGVKTEVACEQTRSDVDVTKYNFGHVTTHHATSTCLVDRALIERIARAQLVRVRADGSGVAIDGTADSACAVMATKTP